MRARYNDMLTLFVDKPLKDNDNREVVDIQSRLFRKRQISKYNV
jgi:hypothetical protein